jgi:hypothetical protein
MPQELIHIIYEQQGQSVVGIETGYRLDNRGVGVRVQVGSRIFFSPRRPDRLWGQPSFLSKRVLGAISPEVKRPGREPDHSPPASAEVKKIWAYTSTPHTRSGYLVNTGTTLPFMGKNCKLNYKLY